MSVKMAPTCMYYILVYFFFFTASLYASDKDTPLNNQTKTYNLSMSSSFSITLWPIDWAALKLHGQKMIKSGMIFLPEHPTPFFSPFPDSQKQTNEQ